MGGAAATDPAAGAGAANPAAAEADAGSPSRTLPCGATTADKLEVIAGRVRWAGWGVNSADHVGARAAPRLSSRRTCAWAIWPAESNW